MLVTALETREGLILQDVQRALVSEELKREQAGEASVAESSGLDSALKATKKPGRQETVQKSPLKCYWCQREGHFQRDCPFKQKQPKKRYNNLSQSSIGHEQQDISMYILNLILTLRVTLMLVLLSRHWIKRVEYGGSLTLEQLDI